MSYLEHLLEWSYPSAVMKSVYSIPQPAGLHCFGSYPGNFWVGVLPLCREVVCVFYNPSLQNYLKIEFKIEPKGNITFNQMSLKDNEVSGDPHSALPLKIHFPDKIVNA